MPDEAAQSGFHTQPTGPRSWVVSWQDRGRAAALALGHGARDGSRRLSDWALEFGLMLGLWARSLRDPHRLARLAAVLFGGALLLVAVLSYAHDLTRRIPEWWAGEITIDPDAAQQVENGLVAHISAVRPVAAGLGAGEPWHSEPWSVSLREDDANSWLNARLPAWLLNKKSPIHWPREVASLRVRFEDGQIRLGAEVLDGTERVIAGVTLAPEMRPDGSLWLRSSGVNVGALPAPGWAVGLTRLAFAGHIPAEVRDLPETRAFFGSLSGDNAIFQNALARIDGGRRVRLLAIAPRQGRLDLTFRTEAEIKH